MKEKNILMIFSGSEGTTYINNLLNKIKHAYIPGYEILDYCHLSNDDSFRLKFKDNILELSKFIFNPNKVLISDEKIQSLLTKSKTKTKQEIIKAKKK